MLVLQTMSPLAESQKCLNLPQAEFKGQNFPQKGVNSTFLIIATNMSESLLLILVYKFFNIMLQSG